MVEGIEDAVYELLPIEDLTEFPAMLVRYPKLRGLNVTIPHKQAIIPFLDRLDPITKAIGAVNTIRVEDDGSLSGFNTDAFGFEQSLRELLPDNWQSGALVLGTGGASKAICWVLEKLEIPVLKVSRTPNSGQIGYLEISKVLLDKHSLIVNTSPLGTFPDVAACPNIPYNLLGPNHYLYDLVYNPEETTFMRLGAAQGATVQNGQQMLNLQAQKSWEIWNLEKEIPGSN